MKKNLPPALKAAARLLALSVVTLGLHSAPAEAQTKQTFSTSGSYLVPAGVTNLVVKAWGAGGASGETETAQRAAGGSGGYVTGVLTVVPGETLNVVIGSPGSSTAGGASTVGAGGNGEPAPLGNNSPAAGGGGGATGVLRTGTPLVIAGGGGGGSSTQAVTPNNGGPGGGSSGIVGGGGAFGGGGGTQAAPGAGGISSNNNGLPGVGSVGGAGSTGNGQNGPGGGGGGGYFGGGGGARGNSGGNSGAGGGGSSFTGSMTDVSNLAGTGAVPAANTDPDYLAGKAVGGTTGAGGSGLVVIIIPPSISNQSVTSIGFFSATLNADINPQGDSTTAYFEWGTSPTLAGATSTASTGLGSGTSNVLHTANLTGLAAHTTYYYRAVATNSGATVRGTIQSFTTLNNLPTVTRLNATVSVDEGSLAANSGTFGDADGDTVTVTASLGTITQGAGTWSWSYTPQDGSVSPTVTITANDGFTGIATTTFTLNVANVAPSIALTGNATVNEGSSYTLNLGTITEPGTDTISGYSIDWGDGSPATSGAGLPPATASHTYVDGAPGGTPRSIVVSLTDEDGTHTAGTKGITVNNVAPTANPQTYTVAEDSGLGTITLVATDPGVLDTISYGLVTGLANPAAGTLGIVSGNTISFTPAADFNGSTTFTFNASADSDTSNTATVTIVVTPVNDAPIGTDDPVASSAEEAARSFSIATLVSNDSKGPADESGQTLTITSIGTVSGGMAVINGANIDFTPDVDFNGPAFITYTVRDDGQTNGVDDFKTSTAKVLFTITPVNDAPVPVNDPLSAINEDSGTRLIPLATLHGNDSTGPGDENTQTLTITSISAVVGGTAVINGANVEFTPTLNYFGPASFTYTVQDNGQSGSPPADDFKSADGQVTFTINSVNDLPGITPGSALTRIAGATATNSPIATVSDIETAPGSLTVTASTVPVGITVSNIVNTAGAITADVSAAPGTAAGPYTVVLNVFDGTDNTTANLTVNVLAVNYTVTTTGNAIVVTDITGNTDTLAVTEPLAGSIKFTASSRAFLIDSTTGIVGDSGNLALTGVTSITVNAATGNDIINVAAFTGTSFPSLTINGGIGNDTVNMNGDITFAANASLDLDLQNDDPSPGIDTITVAASANLLTSGTGTITGKATRNVSMASGSSFETTNGGIVLHGNTPGTAAGNFQGVLFNGGSLKSTGTGDITVEGQGGDDAATGTHLGVHLTAGAVVSSTGTGRITLTGGGGTGTSNNAGIWLNGNTVQVTSSSGSVELTGTGGTGTSTFNGGILVVNGAKILATGSAPITLRGTGGSGSGVSRGIDLEGVGTAISTVDGNLLLTGTGGTDTTNQSSGVLLLAGAVVSSTGTGTVTLDGVTGSAPFFCTALSVDGSSSLVTSVSGNILLRGRPGLTNTGTFHAGVWIRNAGKVTSTGTGAQAATITVDGVGSPGTASNYGVQITDVAGALSSVDGAISIKGAAGGGGVVGNSFGFLTSTTGAITCTGTASVDIRADSQSIATGSTIINAGTNSVTLRPLTPAYPTDLGAADTDTTLGLSDAELDAITAGTLNIGDSASGNITVSAAMSPASVPLVNLVTGGSIKNTNASGTTLTVANSTSSGTFAPGASPGLFSIAGNHVLNTGSTFAVEIGGTSVGTGYDQLSATGAVDISTGVTLNVALFGGFVPVAPQEYVIINRTGGIGTFTGLPEGTIFRLGNKKFKISYVGGTGDDVVLTVFDDYVTVGGTLRVNVPDFGAPTAVPGTLTDTTVIVGRVDPADLADGIQITLPIGKVIDTASATITFFTAPASGTSTIQIGSAASSSITSGGSYTLAAPSASGATYTINVVMPSGSTGSFDYTISITTKDGGAQPIGYTIDGVIRSVVTNEITPSPTGTNDGTQFDILGRGGYLSANGVMGVPGSLKIGVGDVTETPNNFQGYWKDDGSGLKRLVRSSDVAPGTGGALFNAIPTIPVPGLNPQGLVTLLSALRIGTGSPAVTSNDDSAMWSEIGGNGLQLLMRENDPVPGIIGGLVSSFGFGCYATANTSATTGEAVFAIKMKGTTTDSALLRQSITGPGAATVSVVAREKTAAPGAGGELFGALHSTLGTATRMDTTGNIVFEGQIKPSGKFGIWYQPVAGSLSKVFIAGEAAPATSSATFSTFEMPSMGSNGTFAFVGYLNADGDNTANDKNNGVWRGTVADGLSPILRRGDAALPGMVAGSKVGHLWSGWLNQNNRGAWRGWVDTAGDGVSSYPADTFGIYSDIGGTMRLLIASGDSAPGIAGANMFFIDHPVVSGNSGGSEFAAFISTVVGGGVTANVNDKGIWRSMNGAAPTLILRTGDSMVTSQGTKTVFNIDLPGSNMDIRPWELPVMDDTGRLLMVVYFTDGSSAQVIAP